MKSRTRNPYSAERYQEYRLRYLPVQLEAARRKVALLENEARRYGMTDLLENAV